MFTPRVLAVPVLIVAVVSVSACGSSTKTTAAKTTAAATTHTMTMHTTSTEAMPMGSMQNENDAGALAALQAHNTTAATHDLRMALSSTSEAVAAKRYARQALAMVAQRTGPQAEISAMDGAAVEHLTNALTALHARDPKMAAAHLMEASALPVASRTAASALAAIKARDIARAVSVVSKALRGLGA
jgi:hypothetical protein